MSLRKYIVAVIFILMIAPGHGETVKQSGSGKYVVIEQKDLPHQLGTYRRIQNVNDINIEIHTVLLNDNYLARIFRQKTDSQTKAESMSGLNKSEHFLLAINGGFYSTQFKPVGLFIEDGRIINPLSHSSLLNSCVRINHHKVILEVNRRNCLNAYSAMQTGPTLIAQGKIAVDLQKLEQKLALHARNSFARTAKLKYFFAPHRRTVIALADKKVLVIVTSPIALMEMAQVLKDYPQLFGVKNVSTALNLDGGSSTGMYIDFDNQPFYSPEMRYVKTFVFFGSPSHQ